MAKTLHTDCSDELLLFNQSYKYKHRLFSAFGRLGTFCDAVPTVDAF